jgi:Zn-dependent protease
MPGLRQGAIHLGRVAGIDLYLHWSWFVVAVIEIGSRQGRYTSLVWSAIEYLALFAIVLLHEFGHALACRQVGGTVDRIMLWPLGGVAYVNPPQRPAATLWSLAAGPLVNVALLPVFGAAFLAAGALGWANSMPNAYTLLGWILWIDVILLVFNILPIYPLDGGQILRSLLWFFMGRARSLYVATILGFVGAAGLVCLALWMHSTWSLLIAGYMLLSCPDHDPSRKASAARGLCLPVLRSSPARGPSLEMRAVQPKLRHVRISGCLSLLWSSVPQHHVRRVPKDASHQRVGDRGKRKPHPSKRRLYRESLSPSQCVGFRSCAARPITDY